MTGYKFIVIRCPSWSVSIELQSDGSWRMRIGNKWSGIYLKDEDIVTLLKHKTLVEMLAFEVLPT